MAINTHLNNIISAKPVTLTGGLYRGTSASVLPVDATTALDATFKPLGYVTDKGVSVASNVSTTDKKAWGGAVVRTLTTDVSAEITFSLYEFLNADSITAAYGEKNVVTTAKGVAVRFTGQLPAVAPFVIEAHDGDRKIRCVLPAVQITDQGDLLFDDNSTMDLNLKGKAYPDETGALWITYTDLGTTP